MQTNDQYWIDLLNNFLLSIRFFGLSSSYLLLFPQRFGRYVPWASSGVCRTREPSQNFELRPNYSTGVACSDSVSYNRVQVLSIGQDYTCNLQMIFSLEAYGTNAYNRYAMRTIQSEFLELINLMFLLD